MKSAAFKAAIWILATAASATHAAQADWAPEKNVELIVPSGPAGGLDRTARTIQKIWRDRKLFAVPSTVVNKPGGSGAVGYTALAQQKDGHALAIASPTLLTNHILGTSRLNYTDFTPVALLLSEYIVIYVRADSPLANGRDVVERLKRDPAALSIAIGSIVGGTTHIGVGAVLKAAGVPVKGLKTVVFKSGAENLTAILGGHVDLAAGPADQVSRHIATGKIRVIGITSPQRLRGALANVPTWKEQGVDVVVDTWRGIMAPKDLPPAQLAFWDSTFAWLIQTDDWKKDVEANLWDNNYRNSTDAKRMLDVEYPRLKSVLADLGLVK